MGEILGIYLNAEIVGERRPLPALKPAKVGFDGLLGGFQGARVELFPDRMCLQNV